MLLKPLHPIVYLSQELIHVEDDIFIYNNTSVKKFVLDKNKENYLLVLGDYKKVKFFEGRIETAVKILIDGNIGWVSQCYYEII